MGSVWHSASRLLKGIPCHSSSDDKFDADQTYDGLDELAIATSLYNDIATTSKKACTQKQN